ncbi:MAG: hypothetical protein ACREBU_05270 [Nitrososphaera sp.]
MITIIDDIVGTTQTRKRLPEGTFAILVKNFSAANTLSINFDNSALMLLDIAAGESHPFDLSLKNIERAIRGKSNLFFDSIYLVGSAAGTIYEIVTIDEKPSVDIKEEAPHTFTPIAIRLGRRK